MPSTYSTNLRLELMATGEKSGTWGDVTNTNLGTLLEQAISGVASVAHDNSANYSLTTSNGASDQARNAVVVITGTLTADRNLVVPSSDKFYVIKNGTSGGYSLTVKTSGGTGVVIDNGNTKAVYCDATNVEEAITEVDLNQASFGDNKKAIFGAGSDMLIYHDGSHSFVQDQGTGYLYLFSNGPGVGILSSASETMALFTPNGAATLYYDNSAKIATTSSGVNVTGTVVDDGATHDGDVTFTGDSYNAVWDKSDNALEFVDNAKIQMGSSSDLSIYHDGSHSYIQDVGTGYLLLTSNGPGVRINSSAAEVMGDFAPNGAVTLYHDNSAKIATTSGGIDVTGTVTSDGADLDGAVVINEGSADVDFRVESNGNTHMLFVDGGNDRVLVGGSRVTSQPSKLQVTGSTTNQITVKSSGGTGYTQGGIAIEGHASEGTPGDRGQGIYYFNEANDRTYYSGTLYNNGTVWGVGTATGTTLGYDAADNGNACIRVTSAGNLEVVGALSKGSGSFKIDHPLPAKSDTHHLVHSFVEGPQADLIYRGRVDLVDGSATVNIDTAAGMTQGTFVVLCTDVQCFTSNESGWAAVKGAVSGNTLTITAQDNTCTDTISWMVVGERKDAHMVATDWTDDNGKVIVEPLKPVVEEIEE